MPRFLLLVPVSLALLLILGLFHTVTAQSDLNTTLYLPYVTKPEEQPTPTPTSIATPTVTTGATQTSSATTTSVQTQVATATPTNSPTQGPTATTPVERSVRVVSSRSYVSSSTRYVVGEVINNLESPVYSVKLDARFYDANNQLVATEDGFVYLDETRPGQRNPFKLLLSNAPASIVRYDLQITYNTSGFLDYEPITVLSQQVRDNSGVEVFGEVRNDQVREQRSVEVAVTFYDAAGNVVDTDFGFPSNTSLAPGTTSPYQVRMFDSFTYDRFVVQAEGYSTSSQTPTPESNLRVASSRSYVSSNTRYVVGEVINEGTNPAYFVTIAARFYDANNQLVAVEDTYTDLTETRPGQRNPFKLLLGNTPASVVRYDLQLSYTGTSSLDYEPVTVLSQQVRDNFGVEVFGEVRNDQAREMRSVKVAVTFYDSAGNVVDTDIGFPSSTTLAPGATSTYQIRTFDTFTYDRFVVQAEGYLAP